MDTIKSMVRGPAALILAGALLLASGTGALAFADTKITDYAATGVDPTYGNYTGALWASNFKTSSQVIQAENYNMRWSDTNASNVRGRWSKLGPVFHVFDRNTTNCALPFSYTGAYVSNLPGLSIIAKNATCGFGGQYGDYNNEVRLYMTAGSLAGEAGYYGGAEFKLNNGDYYWSGPGKVSNDLYLNGSAVWDEQKDNLPTWCFDSNDNVFGC